MRAWPRIAALAAPRTLMMRAPSRPRPRLCPVPPAPRATRRVLRPLPCSFLLVLLATAVGNGVLCTEACR